MGMNSRHNPARIGEVFRRSGGAVEVVFKDDIKPQEMGALIFAITNTAREMGWTAGQLFAEYYRLEQMRTTLNSGTPIVRAPFGGRNPE